MTYWKLERPSKRSGKKWQVLVPTSSGRGKTVTFGDASMEDYTIHKDKARRADYRTRHQHDHIDDPYKAGFWSWWSLWGESSNLDKAHAAAVKRAKKILGTKIDEQGNEVATKNPRKNPNPPGTPTPTMAEVSEIVAVLDVPKHLRAEFLQGFATEWEHAHTVNYDMVTIGGIVLDHLAEDAHYYRKLRRARLNPADDGDTAPASRVQACFDALLSLVQEQYPSLACTIEVDESAGERGGHACTRAYAFCEDLDDGSFRIAVAHKMNEADDSRIEGLLRHELAHAVLLHGGDLEHTERDADEVAEALFGSPLYYDEDDVQTTDPSAPGARRPRPAYLDDAQGRTLDTPQANPYPTGTMQLETIEDVVSCLDDCAAKGDAKTPRMLASQFSQQAKSLAGAQARTTLALAKAARHRATAIEARLAGEIDRAMASERLSERAIDEAESGGRKNPKAKALFAVKKGDEDWQEQLITENEDRIEDAKKWAAANGFDRFRVVSVDSDTPPDFAGTVRRRGRRNPEWAKAIGRGLYKGTRYAGETARDLYRGAREAHAERKAAASVEGARTNPHFDQYEFRVSSSFLPALINGDTSGLSSSDEAALNRFYKRIAKLGHGHWAVIEDDAGFGQDEITGLGADRALIAWMVTRRNPRASTAPVALMSQDQHNTPPRWRHYFVVDGTDVVIVEMEPAILGGWKTRKITRTPASRDWEGMDADAIVAWKLQNHDTTQCDAAETAHVLAIIARGMERKNPGHKQIERVKGKFGDVELHHRDGIVVGAVGTEPRNYMGLPIEVARRSAKQGTNLRYERSHKIPGIGRLTITPDHQGVRDRAVVDVTKAFADEWDHGDGRSYLAQNVVDAVEKHRGHSSFYAITLKFKGREFFTAYPRGAGV